VTTRRIGGANRVFTSEFTHIDAPRTWGVRGIDGPVRATVDVTVEPLTETSSRLTIAVEFDGHGIGKVLVPLVVRREARKEMPTNLATLKQRLERGPPFVPAQRHPSLLGKGGIQHLGHVRSNLRSPDSASPTAARTCRPGIRSCTHPRSA
jgi:hypothetical protein